MEIFQQGELWKDKDGSLAYDFTTVIIKKPPYQYFYVNTDKRLGELHLLDLDQLEMLPISTQDIWPPFSDQFSRAPELPSENYFIKEPRMLSFGHADTSYILENVLNEVAICEILMKSPHPNLVEYKGCVVIDGRIQGLCLVKYKMTLADRLKSDDPFDKHLCLREIELGIRHLHSLGLVHNDINPSNIMVDEGDHAVIIDFDSCCRQDEKLVHGGTWGWFPEGCEYSKFENDLFGLEKNPRTYAREEVGIQLDSENKVFFP